MGEGAFGAEPGESLGPTRNGPLRYGARRGPGERARMVSEGHTLIELELRHGLGSVEGIGRRLIEFVARQWR